jgi:cytochrome oxidase Cu insertion factor (SCO1/SenC/PrrC family)/uncharacterized membrane protein YphA (DoxX/SURF4 family)
MESIALVARVLLALVFATAAAGKFADQPGTRRALADFGMPTRSLKAVGFLLPLAELAIAVALLVQPSARWGAVAAVTLLLVFVAAIARAMARGQTPDCHCFGQISSSPAGARTLLRNALLAAPALLIVAYGPGESISAWISTRSAAELVAVAGGVAAVALGGICVRLWLTNKHLRDDLGRANEALAAFPPGLPVGTPAPGFELQDVDGRTTSLEALLAERKPVALVFVGANCDACHIMLPDLARWQATLPDRVTIALVGAGEKEDLQELAEGYGLTNMLVQHDAEVFHAYRAAATPSVVIVGPDGRIASPTRATHALVEMLVRRAVHGNGLPTGRPSADPDERAAKAEVLQLPDLTDTPADSS